MHRALYLTATGPRTGKRAIALGTIELEEDILALIEVIDADIEREPIWKAFLHRLGLKGRKPAKAKEPEPNNEVIVSKDETILPIADKNK